MTVRILKGDCREVLRSLPDESVHCIVTSPPYWGLRDYGVDGQIGLENSAAEYVDALVGIFSDLWRVLRDDGTLWLNLGDSYAGGGNYRGLNSENTLTAKQRSNRGATGISQKLGALGKDAGAKPKDLVGIPWLCAFALRANGWYLRQDIIWSKPNPMPESVTDRCTKAHEYLFLLSKAAQYHYDADAVAEPAEYRNLVGQDASGFKNAANFNGKNADGGVRGERRGKALTSPRNDGNAWNEANGRGFNQTSETRNKRSVWEIPTNAFPEAHFATFPPALIEPCILAGCPEGGTVLDPFGGAGTTGLVADRLQRDAVLIELNPEYAAMAERRIRGDAPLFAQVGT